MTATVTLEDAAMEVAKRYAERHEISLSKATSELVLQNGSCEFPLQEQTKAPEPTVLFDPDRSWIKYVNGIPQCNIPQGRTITNAEVLATLEEEF
jgi:hypothetical protein